MLIGVVVLIIVGFLFKSFFKLGKNLNHLNLERIFDELEISIKTVKERGDEVEPYFVMVNSQKKLGVITSYNSLKDYLHFFHRLLECEKLIIERYDNKIGLAYAFIFSTYRIAVFPKIAINDYAGAYKDDIKKELPNIDFMETNDLKVIMVYLGLENLVI